MVSYVRRLLGFQVELAVPSGNRLPEMQIETVVPNGCRPLWPGQHQCSRGASGVVSLKMKFE